MRYKDDQTYLMIDRAMPRFNKQAEELIKRFPEFEDGEGFEDFAIVYMTKVNNIIDELQGELEITPEDYSRPTLEELQRHCINLIFKEVF